MIDRRTLSILFTIAVVVGIIALVYAARHTVIAIIFAVFLAYILEPIAGFMQKWVHTRVKAVAATYLALLAAIVLILLTTAPRAVREVQHLNERLPELLENIGSGRIAWSVGREHQWSDATKIRLQKMLADNRQNILRITEVVKEHLGMLFTNLAWVLVIPVLSVFIMLGRASLSASVLKLINVSHEQRILKNVLSDLDLMLAQYIRAQVLLSVLAAAAYTIFLIIIRFPYAFAMGPIAGILEFIPLVGPLLAGISILTIAFGTGFGHWISIIAFWLVWRGIQDYYNMPHLMRRGLELHPLLAVTSVLAGGEVAGVLGMFLSIPAVGVIRVIWRNAVERDKIISTEEPPAPDVDAAA